MKIIYRKKKILSLCVLMFLLQNTKAQYDAMFTQYMYNEMFINPAYAGSKEAMSVTALHRQQWLNFPGRPITTTFSLHGPLMQNKMGLGLSVLNERIGVLNRNLIYASYAYRLKLNSTSNLAFGLMAGVHNQVYKFSDLKTNNDGSVDPILGQNSPSILSPNFGFGIYYTTKTFYAGLSIPRMIDDQLRFMNGDPKASLNFSPTGYHYYFTLGNVFTINNDLKLKAQTMVKAVQNSPLQVDANVNLLIKDLLWVGAGYRYNAAAVALIGINITPQFLVSYSYDYALNSIQNYSYGSHEIVLNYLFSYKSKKIVTPRYF
ncbi:MAG: type IX secretion system membrane protein PorP/SprF [Bacteroidetes bacterium]|nr:type IX secretion system membrane protein PorP/SprF [Bacteroidota bacterium]